eukprot:CAMPEP_0201897610 /NCGR_PEP_ID=MMETSP0902-20130614/46906_1 /ASSEMBLY_ACC=CAM_ASM_000551 /TAXON_ID=420261 /ORGANISM="Thalassiosira antarctica, Strain CCMP982" /LENGTH=286 /DNA_ID=CAMNT_0048430521 /DNA_START=23 /DNA_END=883 /DNA_ORIENTATION=-
MALRRRFIYIYVFLVWPSNLVAAVSQSTTRVVQKSITVSNRERIAADNQRDISRLSLLPSSNFYRRGGDIQEVSDEKYKISLSPLAFTSIFGFLGGWSHALCNKQFDVYTAMVTGHILNLSIFLAEKNWKEALSRISIIGSYFGGVASARSLELKCERGRLEGTSNNHHFKIIATLVVVIFSIADMTKLEKAKIALLTFGFGLVYPSVSAALGGTITHLMTGHTTNVARLVGAKQMRHRGMKTSVCVLGSVITGGFFGTKVLGLLGDEFPYFTVLGFLYAAALLLL